MEKKKNIGFGFRGWMLMIYQFMAYLAMVAFTNWPMNALSETYTLGSLQPAIVFTVATIIGIIIQLILSRNIGKVKNIKRLSIVLAVVSMAFALCVMLVKPGIPWMICYFFECLVVSIWCTFIVGILIGQWFPRRKGTVMGIVTFAFPIGNALMALFSQLVQTTNIFTAYLPFFILICVGILIGIIFVKDYPEQCGAFRDNDKSLTPEVANAMMEQEIENKKTTVWKIGHSFKSPDFWCVTLPAGFLLMGAVGMMAQTAPLLKLYDIESSSQEFGMIMLGVAVVACLGSWIIGILDTKFGTKKAMLISVILMVASGILGATQNFVCLLFALGLLGMFMGASSNFTVSAAVQYWRREDFPSVFAGINPIANIFNAIGPMVIMMLIAKGKTAPFAFVGIIGAIAVILILMFKPARIKALDDKYRAEAGKPVDDELANRL